MDYSDEPRDCSYDEPRFFEPTLHISDPEPPCPIDHWVDDPEPTHCPCCEEADCPSKREIENHYDCDSCGHEWEMTCCNGCDDECPE